MDREALKRFWLNEEQQNFRGWDFSYIEGRWEEETLPWNYKEIVHTHLKPNMELLDMGTGGGEFLFSLGHPYDRTSVTEAWPPNIELCNDTLAPLGIRVEGTEENAPLPFEDESFDIIINRHESYNLDEVWRVLRTGGVFITQQVGGKNNADMTSRLIPGFEVSYSDFTLQKELMRVEATGFQVMSSDEYYPILKFMDIGALVYFAKIIEWEFPEFSVEKCLDTLYKLESERLEKGYVTSKEHRFIMMMCKP